MTSAYEEIKSKRTQDLIYWQQQAALTDEQMLLSRDLDYCCSLRALAIGNIKSINESIASDDAIVAYVKKYGTDEG